MLNWQVFWPIWVASPEAHSNKNRYTCTWLSEWSVSWDCTCNLRSGSRNGRHGKGIHFDYFLPAAETFFHLVQFPWSQLLLENKSQWKSWGQHEEGLWFHPFHNIWTSSGRYLQGAPGLSVSASVVCSCFCYWHEAGKTGIMRLSWFSPHSTLGNFEICLFSLLQMDRFILFLL